MTVTEGNAYRYQDNFQIANTQTGDCVGVEHNEQEAKAIVAWLNNRHGGGYCIVRNSADDVRRGKELRNGKDAVRVKMREEILLETGVWK